MKDVFVRCFKKTADQVCIMMCLTSCNIMYPRYVLPFPMFRESDLNTDWCLFFAGKK
jgi:hypothetical protein